MRKVTTIDDIMHPGESERRESAELAAGIHLLNSMLHALSVLDRAKPAAQDSPRTAMGSEKGCHTEPQDCSGSTEISADLADGAGHGNRHITHADGTSPRTGVNIIRLSTGRCVQCLVIYASERQYQASEMDYDEGRPTCMSDSPLAALELLRESLEVEIETEAQRRDAEFRAVLRRVNCEDCE